VFSSEKFEMLIAVRLSRGPSCDGIVTGIQIKGHAGDIAAYRIIKNPQ